MNLLLTGSRGFIGQRLVGLLQAERHRVVEFAGDLRDAGAYPSERYDAVIHLAAAIPHRGPATEREFDEINHQGTRRLLQHFPQAHFVLASTADVSRNPLTAYAQSKAAAEALVRAAPSHCIVRLPSVFGPRQRQRSKLIPTLLSHHVLGTPPPPFLTDDTREYLWVDDAAAAFAKALRQQGTVEAPGVRISNQDLATLIAAACRADSPQPENHRRLFAQLRACADALRAAGSDQRPPPP